MGDSVKNPTAVTIMSVGGSSTGATERTSPRTSARVPVSFGSRFEVIRHIAEGGMGDVFEAFDRSRNARCAIKTLLQMSSVQLQLFKNEFRALQDVAHPNVLRLGELFEHDGRYFFTMEMIDGVDMVAYVQGTEGSQLRELTMVGGEATEPPSADTTSPGLGHANVDRLRQVTVQVVEGLTALHRAAMVHRDIKPSNILVDADGKVTILDFGLIAQSDVQQSYEAGRMLGTLKFMSPEQSRGEPAGPESDWYSLGVVLFYAVTGRFPFTGRTDQMLERLRSEDGPAPSTCAEGIPEDLDRLITSMLCLDPKARPSGAEILQRLTDRTRSPALRSGTRFIGRTAELGQLRGYYHAYLTGTPTTLFVSGASGQGKSALIQQFTEGVAQDRGLLLLRGRCFERDTVAYRALDQVIDALCNHLVTLSPDVRDTYLTDESWRITELFPAFGAVAPVRLVTNDAPDREAFTKRQLAFAAVRALFERFARTHHLLVVIDDLQWADADSLALLNTLRRGRMAPHIFWLASVRTGSALHTPAALMERIGGETDEIALGPLADPDALALAESIAVEAELSADAFDGPAICREAGGHPLLIDVLVQFRAAGGAERDGLSLDDALFWRAQQMQPFAREVLELLALHGVPVSQRVAVDALQVNFETFDEALAELRASRLIRTSGPNPDDQVETYHDRVRESVVARLPQDRAIKRHLGLANALKQTEHPDAELIAVHLRAAGEHEEAVSYFLDAAAHADTALAFDRAARLFRDALEVLTDASMRGTVLVSLGHALANGGHGRAASEAFMDAIATSTRHDATNLARLAAEQLLRAGHYDKGVEVLADVLPNVGLSMPKTRFGVLMKLLKVRIEVALRSQRPRSDLRLSPKAAEQMAVCETTAVGLGMADNIAGAIYQARALLLSLRSGNQEAQAVNFAREACFFATIGRLGRGRVVRLLAQSDALAKESGSQVALGWSKSAGGVTALLQGRFVEARDLSEQGEALLCKLPGVAWELGTLRTFLLWCYWYTGDLERLHASLPEVCDEALRRGDIYSHSYFRLGFICNAWLGVDDPHTATKHCEEAIGAWTKNGFHLQHAMALYGRTQIAIYEGDFSRAHDVISRDWPALSRSLLLRIELLRYQMLDLRGRAMLALGAERGDPRLVRAAVRDAKRLLRIDAPSARPMGHMLLAGAARVRGDHGTAIQHYGAAVTAFDAAGMPIYRMAAEYRQGELIEGDVGQALVTRADEELRARGVVAPKKMVACLAP